MDESRIRVEHEMSQWNTKKTKLWRGETSINITQFDGKKVNLNERHYDYVEWVG